MPSPVAAQRARLTTLLAGVSEAEAEAWGAEGDDARAKSTQPSDAESQAENYDVATPSLESIESRADAAVRGADAGADGGNLAQVRARVLATAKGIASCASGPDSDVVVFVSKMMPVRVSELSPRDQAMLSANSAASATAAAVGGGGVGEVSTGNAGDGEVISIICDYDYDCLQQL